LLDHRRPPCRKGRAARRCSESRASPLERAGCRIGQ